LSRSALTLFRAVHQIAVEAAAARNYHPGVSEVVIFAPVEAVGLALGVHRVTVWRAAAELRAAGLVAHRAHYCTLRGRTRSDGAVWAVRLRPVGGCAARVPYDALKRSYRNLSGDIEAGRTVWADLQQSREQPKKAGVQLEYVRRWALSPTSQEPVKVDSCTASRSRLEAVLDVPHAERGERARAVDLGAQALAQALADRGGVMFYRRLLWALLRRSDAGGAEHFQAVYLAAVRAAVDSSEGFARKPGALFVSRLKACGWFGEAMGPPRTTGPQNHGAA
jgi:hypothetical protein